MAREERRRFPQYPAPETLAASAHIPAKGEHRLRLRSISLEGLSFVTDLGISTDTFFNLSLEIPKKDGGTRRIATPAKIVWCAFNERTWYYTAGVQFLGMTEEDRDCLQDFLKSLTPQGDT